jgi:hypothetical protein
MRLLFCVWWFLIGLGLSIKGQSVSAPFFNDTAMVSVVIRGDLKPLFKDKRDEDREYRHFEFGVISTTDTTFLPLKIKARGNFRRNLCKLPPLKLNFKKGDLAGTPLDGLDKVKLVLPCRPRNDKFDQLVHLEYLTYRLYNHLTDSSFRVRPLQVHFVDTGGKYDPWPQFGFVIEPVDVLAQRLGGWESETEKVHPSSTDIGLTNLMSTFQFMIGNTDWSIPGLHNIKLVKTDTFTLPLAIPYDFDFCGLVDAPYAKPNPQLGISMVTERKYRGFCRPQAEMEKVYARFRAQRPAMISEIENWPLLDPSSREKALRFLEDFFVILENERRRSYHFEQTCRN